ncbi:hypothetical protein D3C81_1934940 [compost metagenome]
MVLVAMGQNNGVQPVNTPLLQKRQQGFGSDLKRTAADAPLLLFAKADRTSAIYQNMRPARGGNQNTVALPHIQVADGSGTSKMLRVISSIEQQC